ncbi:MAG: hypothetical protein ACFFCI_14955 [Promethearchaeota archaeon]
MRIKKKIMFIFCSILISLVILPTKAVGQTTIRDSTFPAEMGDTYTWVCTYCHPNFSSTIGTGSYQNVTIDRIYQGSFSAISDALIVEATVGYFIKATSTQESFSRTFWVVYNFTLGYIDIEFYTEIFIVPIPLNLTMICAFIESTWGGTCNSSGNQMVYEDQIFTWHYNFNSNGILTKMITYLDDTKFMTFELSNAGLQISFGYLYILLSFISVAIISLTIKRRKRFI